jgi:hypothetical protein
VFLQCPVVTTVLPIWGGGAFLLLFLAFILPIITAFQIIASIIMFLGFLFFAIYYFTMPQKECLFNRADGLVTFPGFMWHKNITMSIHKVLFAMSSPSMQGGGAFNLQIVRPDKTYSLWLCTLGMSCYEDLSFFLWYMDKNRPVPPGEGFDKYRDKDFRCRKAEGFPKPLFDSEFPTPEATEEQQKERELIGGW